MIPLYLAGRLFNAAERLHIIYLAKHLQHLGHEVILPQKVALQFFKDGKFNTRLLADNCDQSCTERDMLYVGCIDGPDADSGTAVEYGLTIGANRRAIIYRTDFRTDMEKEIGVNSMFQLRNTIFIYCPCYFTELSHVDPFYQMLAQKIHEGAVIFDQA
jgi:nucleoside 2-deoxyribosyltransferase